MEKDSKVFQEAEEYLDNKFDNLNVYQIIGFLENYKALMIEEIRDLEEED